MRRLALPALLLLAALASANPAAPTDDRPVFLVRDPDNATLVDEVVLDSDGQPVVRQKRTFGDIVFRGLADVLGYDVARKPPQADFPPPLAPVAGIDFPLQAAAPAPAAPPCPAARAAGPPPCATPAPPPPPPPPPCPKPRAAPRPKPRPTTKRPPPSPPPPCARPRANPTTPAPCPPPPPPPPPPKKTADGLETITSNFRLNFNFNRGPATPAPGPGPAPASADEGDDDYEEQSLGYAPVAIEPRAARLPAPEPARKPRVYVDAVLVRDGVAERVDAVDAKRLAGGRAAADADDDYLAENDSEAPDDYDYENAQESRDRAKAVREFGTAVDQFWENKKRKAPRKNLPEDHYQNVHFGERDVAQRRSQSLQRSRPRSNSIPESEGDEEGEATTTTEDPRRPLTPRVLPPTEHNPGQIDTVTVRVPPIYREKHPKKLNRERPERPDREEEESDLPNSRSEDSSTEDAAPAPTKRRSRRKRPRRTRSTDENGDDDSFDVDYFGRKLPVSEEEKFYAQLTVPPPTVDADVARHERLAAEDDSSESERIREDPERLADDEAREDSAERTDDAGRADSGERGDGADGERADSSERAGEHERTDELSPNARVRETGYTNNYVRATNVRVEDPRPARASLARNTHKLVSA